MIPRDTMTRITLTDLSGNVLGKDVQHLTLAYAYGDGRELSCEYTVEAVSELLGGLTIDHYMAVDTDSISVLNDGVGGVTVTIEEPGLATRDPELKLGETVTLKGKQAETFVRYRDIHQDNTALFRMDRHQQYMEGFFAALKTKAAEDDSILIRLLDSIQDHMVTDMQKDQYLKAALDVLNTQQLGSGDFYTLPGSGVTTARYDEFYVDQEAMIPVILDLFYREIE
jgi:LCP family protein required for cell wall assembly